MNKTWLHPKVFSKNVERVSTRDGFGEGLLEAGKTNDDVVALVADLTESTRMLGFKEEFPERFIEVGVAEQNLVTVASGMAAVGKIPYTASYATFSPGRNWEQIRTTICYNDQPVIVVGSHAGISVGPDGATHQALEDIAMMRVLPNMTVVAPCDVNEANKATVALATHGQPAYLRLARNRTPVITRKAASFTIGMAETVMNGSDVTIVAAGPLLYEALVATKTLASSKISAEVINSHTIKPLDKATVLTSCKKTGAVVTVEEHQIIGGLGGAVAELLGTQLPLPLERVGVNNHFGESGKDQELLKKFHLKAPDIVKAAKQAIKRKA